MPITLAYVGVSCIECIRRESALEQAHRRIQGLEDDLKTLTADHAKLKTEHKEFAKLVTLQADDLKRLKALIKSRPDKNQPERVAENTLQAAFDYFLDRHNNDGPLKKALDEAKRVANDDEDRSKPKPKKGGRRKLDGMEGLPVIEERIVPPEVTASGGEGWKLMGEETSDRLFHQRAKLVRIRTVREKWVKVSPGGLWKPGTMVTADLPDWCLPRLMADTSVLADFLVGKYGFSLPLNRKEKMNQLSGFPIARSTMSDWTETSSGLALPVVDAMHAESLAESFQLATDATGAPVRIKGGTAHWHLFVFISDAGHITFRPTRHHSSAAIQSMLEGFEGHLLADASSIYKALYLLGVVAVACWAHVRRYFWKATLTEPELANQAMALIKAIFDIAAKSKKLRVSDRAAYRLEYAGPIIAEMDIWVQEVQSKAEEGGKVQRALTYYANQREALGRFVTDGRLEADNNGSERELRNLVMGLNNWQHFETKAGLQWFAVFRSLISSCKLHDINPYLYLEQMLRLARHWPADRKIELSPKYWRTTVEGLNAHNRAIIEPPWMGKLANPRAMNLAS